MKKIPVTFNKEEKTAEILIYGPIGASMWGDGIGSKEFTEALNEIPKGTKITLGINSQGGEIGEGLAIFNAIERRASDITARIDGYALSAGSFIPLAASKVVSPDSAIWMIHKGWSYAQGNADEMRKAADLLDTHDSTLIDIYTKRTGKSREEIEEALSEETWMTGAEAIAYGLADESGGTTDAKAMASIDLSKGKFKHPVGKILAGLIGGKPSSGNATSPGIIPATLSAPLVAAAVVVNPAAQTAKKDPNSMSENIATPAADKTAEILAKLEALENKLNKPAAASAPVAPAIQNLGNPLVEKYNAVAGIDHAEAAKLVRAYHLPLRKALIEARKGDLGVYAANTVDSNLVNSTIASDFLTTMRTRMAPLAAFSHQVSANPKSARQVLNVNLLSTAGATQDNPTDFETGDTTSAAKQVTLAHVNRSFHTTNAEQDLGLELMQKAPTNALVMAEGIMAKVTALMTNANYGADVVIGTAANFDYTDLRAVLALGKNYARTTLLLDGGHLAYLLPADRESFVYGEPGAYGFDGGIYKNNFWTSAAADIAGFVCGPDAIVWAAAPVAGGPSGSGLTTSNIVLPEIGIIVQANTWYSLKARAMWASYDVCFGAAVGDATQAEVLTTQ